MQLVSPENEIYVQKSTQSLFVTFALTKFNGKIGSLVLHEVTTKTSHFRIAPNLRSTVYSIGIKDANESTWMKVFNRFQTETVPSEKRKLMYALTNSRNEGILKRYSMVHGNARIYYFFYNNE